MIGIGAILGTKPVKQEYIGVGLSLLGCLCLILDPSAERADGAHADFSVALVDLASACFGAFYFLMNAHNVKTLPICTLVFFLNFHSWLINYLIAASYDDEVMLLSIDPKNGMLGFFHKDAALVAFIPYGILGSFFGGAGYVMSLLFYTPVVTSNAFLLEPFVS
jgi:drug/metabolite transporter (DMT)-like permease